MWKSRPARINRLSLAFVAFCAALWLLIGSSGGAAFAASAVVAGEKAVVTNTDGDLIRIREDVGTAFAKVGTAREGDVVAVLEGPRTDKAGDRWFRVQAQGSTGWMAAEFLRGTGVAVPLQERTKLTGSAVVANTDGDPLRMRATPGASGKVITLLDPGVSVVIQTGPLTDEAGIVWYEITAKGEDGWAMAQYLSQGSTSPAVQKKAAVSNPAAVTKPAATAPAARPHTSVTATPKPGAPPAAPVAPTSSKALYRQWVEEARQMYPYPQSSDKMWRVMLCESGGNPGASGGGGAYLGLFQYAPSTWVGMWNPYRESSIWDAHAQIFATAKAWSIGMQGHWSCFYMT